jgi:hypothetical protein
VIVTEFIIYLFDVPICGHSKSQKGVTLLSTGAKYVVISKAVKEFNFVYYLLCDLHIKVNFPIMVMRDSLEAIFMSENASTGFLTWHVDTRYHFVHECIEDGFIEIAFVRSAENDVIYF